ncbi:MAG: FtsW/RodA/SpoVE family cell cycle protein [Bacteroidaceae bacterium]|nr:FtsW/RodA/SpoVE family cell cycle protein [Bacteroidaceae bacterium]
MKPHLLRQFTLPLITAIIVLLFLRLSQNYEERHKAVEAAYISETSVNLSDETEVSTLTNVLLINNYMQNKADAEFAARHIIGQLQSGKKIEAFGDFAKRAWQIPATVIDSIGSPLYRERLAMSRNKIECDSLYDAVSSRHLSDEVVVDARYQGCINVTIERKNPNANILQRSLGLNKIPACGDDLVVRLARVYTDSSQVVHADTIAYARPNKDGEVVFKGLDTEQLYSVLPIRRGCEYGASKGTIGGSMASNGKTEMECAFTEQEHRVRLFDTATMKQIKSDRTITVRTPEQFRSLLVQDVVILLLLWWLLSIYFNVRQRYSYMPLINILMFITGISLLVMYSINDPLTDELKGHIMAGGIFVGIAMMFAFLHIDFTKFYQDKYHFGFDALINLLRKLGSLLSNLSLIKWLCNLSVIRWIFSPYKRKVSGMASTLVSSAPWWKKLFSLIGIIVLFPLIVIDGIVGFFTMLMNVKGGGFMLMALLLTVLLFTPLGSEVGGMKVNLNLGIKFQPSEIAKYLVIFFMAAFFCVNADKIMQYSSKGNAGMFGSKLKVMLPVIIALLILLLLYFFLGDMGPAMVLAFTFIIVYSIIKSKVTLEGATDEDRLQRILSSDIAMLVYGVVSFIVLLVIGNILGNMIIFALLWLVLWLAMGWKSRQIFETPIFFNAVIAMFLFGGNMFGCVPESFPGSEKFHSIAERLDSRMEMCTNTWGTLPLDNHAANAGENTQVVEGLWGLATGGFFGQGLGNGSPQFIPAYHTDMILESIGEQMGWVGIIVVLLLVAMLLRKTIVIGYQSSHPFAFYLCTGIAVVTAVQFIIISLGSTGMIPLTGVTVPFLSYGRVSMILNLAAYGVVLSVALHNRKQQEVSADTDIERLRDAEMRKYEFPISILSMVYIAVVCMIGEVFFYYQCMQRDETLIRPVYVNNVDGAPTLEYNPRIAQLAAKLRVGDIYDRNGVLLATSDRTKLKNHKNAYTACGLDYNSSRIQRRYYPFGEHLFFTLGDFNTGLLFSTSRGYMAEARHLSDLRGYDNIKRDKKNKQPIKVKLKSNEYRPSRYHSASYDYVMSDSFQLRDYSALLPYLRAGVNSDKVSDLNRGKSDVLGRIFSGDTIVPKDIKLTIDARLQTRLQQGLEKHVNKIYSSDVYNKLRISVVLLDAKNGDLLTSANYPLPDYERLREDGDKVYKDYETSSTWRAYTDMDLGLMFPTAPGSSAKVMTAMAGLRKGGVAMGNQSYYVHNIEKILASSEPTGRVNMKLALEQSSNVYFIKLANDKNLYADMAAVYAHTGVGIKKQAPYILNYTEPTSEWMSLVTNDSAAALERYRRYKKETPKKMNTLGVESNTQWSWAWGQGTLTATPLAMARVASIAANGGEMPVTRYVIDEASARVITVVGENEARKLNGYMKSTSLVHDKIKDNNIGGKTGTPERSWYDENDNVEKYNDGWYICFIEKTNNQPKTDENKGNSSRNDAIAIAIRLERLGGAGSKRAVNVLNEVVIPVLRELKYY